MQARDKVHGPRSESEGMGEHRIESPPFCYLILQAFIESHLLKAFIGKNLRVTAYKHFMIQSHLLKLN
jgi:hypothetical protein